MKEITCFLAGIAVLLAGCGAKASVGASDGSSVESVSEEATENVSFSADSAYMYVSRQVEFGPRVPNTQAHRQAGEWLASKLESYGAKVISQTPTLTAFDGTKLQTRNIFGQFNPEASERILLLAHWDCRPWADQDPDPAKRKMPVDGANDGASGVGVLLEIARQLAEQAPSKGVDILFTDAEDWGTDGNEESWAMGTRYFAENPPVSGYAPREAILLDMVGGENPRFPKEYFSEKSAPGLNGALWSIASEKGYASMFPERVESAVTDDHIQLIEAGIPTVDIIEYHPQSGFNSRWHTTSDNMEGISKETLGAVGHILMTYLRRNY